MSNILVAEDEPRIASFVAKGLRANGHRVTVADAGPIALALAGSDAFDLMILDVGLPDMDGISVLRRLRASGVDLPVVVLSARDGVTDKVRALDNGADDYVTKPFAFDELLARVRARLRPLRSPDDATLRAGPVTLDLRSRRLDVAGRGVDLTAREFALAEVFFRHPGQVLSREQLLSQVWGYDFDPGSNVVDVYVGYLRRKLGARRLVTVRGMGYRFEPEATPDAAEEATPDAAEDATEGAPEEPDAP